MSAVSAGEVLRTLADVIDRQDWDGLAALLAPGFTARLVHTGETFDAAGYVRLNREYPGSWAFGLEDVVAADDRAAGRARVSDGDRTFHVAVFLTLAEGHVCELVEVWADGAAEVPEHRPST